MDYHQTVSRNIKKLCRLQKITYSELARRAKLPLMTLQGLLYKTRKEPRLSTIHAIAKALKISIDELLK
jgi:transcriptional regulator with XRE-family HTH domain